MYILSINIWFQKLMKQFFFGIDSVIYNFISSIYDLLISIARTSVLSQADILEMADKIYKLLAVFMIFKVTFSLITYVVNPDDFSDKNKGISKLITNIITSLGLLILTPYIFNMAYRLQAIILEDNTLATLIFETEKEQAGGTAGDFINSAGDEIAFMTMRPFFTPNTSIKELQGCIDLTDINGKFNPICSGIDNETKEKCNSAGECGLEVEEGFDAANTMAAIIDEKLVQNYVVGINNKNLGLMFRQDLAVAVTVKDEFVMEYKYVFSTVVGVVVVLLLITYCMDVALRSIKLSFLQLIAPIPILSYIDPKSGKDGLFKKWYQLCFKTYLSLFIRLLALYFAVYIIDKVADMQLVDIIDGSQQTNFLISIFIIIGALMFAKDLPKILEGLGIKLDGGGKFTLNPIKKFTEQAAGGKKILGFAGAAGAAGLAGTVNFGSRMFDKNNWKNENGKVTAGSIVKGLGKSVGSGVAGTTSAAYRGSKKAMKGESFGKTFASSYGEAMFAKLQREDLERKGSTLVGRIAADFNRHTGNLNAAQRQTLDLATLDGEKKSRTDALKLEREQMELSKQKMITEKNNKIKVHNENKAHLSAINQNISSLKNNEVNVVDKDKRVNDLKTSGQYYAKIGDYVTIDGERKIVDEEMLKDSPEGIKTDEARIADKQLDEEKERALEWLKQNDQDTKNRIELLGKNGIEIDENPKNIKKEIANQDSSLRAIDSSYYSQENYYKEQEEKYKLEEKSIEDWYKEQIKERDLDKDSAQWIANEADNAARSIKTPQPEGFKPTASVDNNIYTPFTTGVVLGDGPDGGSSHGPHGGNPPRPHGH